MAFIVLFLYYPSPFLGHIKGKPLIKKIFSKFWVIYIFLWGICLMIIFLCMYHLRLFQFQLNSTLIFSLLFSFSIIYTFWFLCLLIFTLPFFFFVLVYLFRFGIFGFLFFVYCFEMLVFLCIAYEYILSDIVFFTIRGYSFLNSNLFGNKIYIIIIFI